MDGLELRLTLRQGSNVITARLEDNVPEALDLARKLFVGMDMEFKPFAITLEECSYDNPFE